MSEIDKFHINRQYTKSLSVDKETRQREILQNDDFKQAIREREKESKKLKDDITNKEKTTSSSNLFDLSKSTKARERTFLSNKQKTKSSSLKDSDFMDEIRQDDRDSPVDEDENSLENAYASQEELDDFDSLHQKIAKRSSDIDEPPFDQLDSGKEIEEPPKEMDEPSLDNEQTIEEQLPSEETLSKDIPLKQQTSTRGKARLNRESPELKQAENLLAKDKPVNPKSKASSEEPSTPLTQKSVKKEELYESGKPKRLETEPRELEEHVGSARENAPSNEKLPQDLTKPVLGREPSKIRKSKPESEKTGLEKTHSQKSGQAKTREEKSVQNQNAQMPMSEEPLELLPLSSEAEGQPQPSEQEATSKLSENISQQPIPQPKSKTKPFDLSKQATISGQRQAEIVGQPAGIHKEKQVKPSGTDSTEKREGDSISKKDRSKSSATQKSDSEEARAAMGATYSRLESIEFSVDKPQDLEEAPASQTVKELAQQIVERIQVMRKGNETYTQITVKHPPMLDGATITLVTSDEAKREFKISFANLTPEGKKFLDKQLKESPLSDQLESKGFVVRSLTTTTETESLIPTEDTKAPPPNQRKGKEGNQKEK